MTRKGVLIAVGMTAFTLLVWFLWSDLWLERLRNYSRLPVHGKNWNNEKEKFEKLYTGQNADCFFLGDSHIEQCEWQELIPELRCANRGIGSESSSGLLDRISIMPAEGKGRTVILQTGINDLIYGDEPEMLLHRYALILDYLIQRNYRPVATLLFPVRYLKNINKKAEAVNSGIAGICTKRNCPVISINKNITTDNLLSEEFSADGLHLNYKGYRLWAAEIRNLLMLPADSCCR